MARRYTRDNRGRFASAGGGGATARGGRLRTASGKKRATQTMKAEVAGGDGVIRGRTARTVAGEKAMGKLAKRPEPAKPVPKVKLGAEPDKARMLRNMTNPGIRQAYATQGGKAMSPLDAKKVARSQATAEAARKFYGTSSRDRPKPAAKPAANVTPKAAAPPRQKAKLPRMATPSGAIRKSDLAKVKQDAKTGIGTPVSRAAQRSIARSAREAPLQRRDAIQAAKRQGKTGFGAGPAMNTKAISSRDFAWNKNETPASPSQRLSMWRQSERRIRRAQSQQTTAKGVSRSAAGEMRASRMAAKDVDLGVRRGSLPTTKRMAELPRQRRLARIAQNEAQGRLNAAYASQKVLPKVEKLRRSAAGKKATAAQKAKERQLVSEYNKLTRKLTVAQAAKAFTQNPYGFTPSRMSGRK